MKSATRICDASVDENAETRADARVHVAMTTNEFLQICGIAKEIEREIPQCADKQLLYLKR